MEPALRAIKRCSAWAALSSIGLCSLACGGRANEAAPGNTGGSSGFGQAGSAATADGGQSGSGPTALSSGGSKLRVLTRTEYKNSLTDLLGPISTTLELPEDVSVAGFVSVGAAELALRTASVKQYEAAGRAAVAEVFGDDARRRKLVGCEPKADLSDACVTTFIESFGRRAFRHDLSDAEVAQWLQLARDGAVLASSAALGLGNAVSGMLQSPQFLYRIESNQLDVESGRFKYDGRSMATRLAYLLTGSTPSDALLAAAAAGRLDTADGVKEAAAPLLTDARALERMVEFFGELSQADRIRVVEKDPKLFPNFDDAMRTSMLEATKLFIKNVVLAPGADVRSFFDSDQTFVDLTLAPLYDVSPPASGFQQITLGPQAGRAGILGQVAVIAGHSAPDHTLPSRRGLFIATNLLCQQVPLPPAGVVTTLPENSGLTERQKLAEHLANPACSSGCHELIDPLGLALEHLDPIGKYRATEGDLEIDATGVLDGVRFDGAAELGAVLRDNPRAKSCLVSSLYRDANGVASAEADASQVSALTELLAAKGYVWRDVVAEFVASDAFRSAPAATAGE